MNPIEIFYCWQALIVTVIVYMLTQLVKVILNSRAYFKVNANRQWWLKRVILPGVPPLLGFITAASLPLHPDVMVAFFAEHAAPAAAITASYGAWGAAVGQFTDYLYSKVTAAHAERKLISE